MKENSYLALLKHPLWQKRRLEILQRDNFTCQICGKGINDGTTLNVHHKQYVYGKMPWEYDNTNLVTLCEKCHKIQHGVDNKTNNGIVFYRALLKEGVFTIREKIIISYLLSKKITNLNEANKTEIANKLGINRSTVIRLWGKLNKYEELRKYTVNGFFPLKIKKGLSGQLLVFFSWLYSLAGQEKTIYADRLKLASMYHVKLHDIRWYLHRLKELGFIERQNDGKLLIK